MSTERGSLLFPSPSAVASYLYPQTVKAEYIDVTSEPLKEPEVTLSERSLAALVASGRAEGYAEAERALRSASEKKSEDQAAQIKRCIQDFEKAQRDYFLRVEAEVVQLALSVAGKILHREAQVDPMLLRSIVRFALTQLGDGSAVSLRVRQADVQRWREHLCSEEAGIKIEIVEDNELQEGDCILESELGVVNLGIEPQLREIERGFFDLLAQKPRI